MSPGSAPSPSAFSACDWGNQADRQAGPVIKFKYLHKGVAPYLLLPRPTWLPASVHFADGKQTNKNKISPPAGAAGGASSE